MPRYFFILENEYATTPDLVGRDLPDDHAAKNEAAKLAAELGIHSALEGKLPAYQWVEAVDEEQRPVTRLAVSASIRGPDRLS
jgi:hypothetical protein